MMSWSLSALSSPSCQYFIWWASVASCFATKSRGMNLEQVSSALDLFSFEASVIFDGMMMLSLSVVFQ